MVVGDVGEEEGIIWAEGGGGWGLVRGVAEEVQKMGYGEGKGGVR